MEDAGYVLRNLETAQEQSFEQLDDALDAVQVPFIETSQHWAIFSSGEQAPDRTPMAVGAGPFGVDGSTIIGCRPDATPRISDSR